jgi:hypothetical protein
MIHVTGGGGNDPIFDARMQSAYTGICVLAQIRTSAGPWNDGTNQFPFASAIAPTWNPSTFPPASVKDLTGLTAELDPVTRTLTLGQGALKLLPDGSVVDLMGNNASPVYLKNKLCYVFIGPPDFGGNFVLPYGVYVIANVLTDPSDGGLTIILKDPKNLPEKVQLQPTRSTGSTPGNANWPCKHPLEHYQRLLSLTGISSSYFDASLNASSWSGSLGHLNCSRFVQSTCTNSTGGAATSPTSFDGGITSEFNARSAAQELEKIWGGSIYWDETGVWKARAWNAGASVVDTWTLDDIDELEMVDNFDEIHFNQFSFTYAASLKSNAIDWVQGATPNPNLPNRAPNLVLQDNNSITRYTTFFDGSGVYPTSLDSAWLNGVAPATSFAGGVGNGATIVVWHAPQFGFCGCRCDGGANGAAASIPAWAQLSNSQLAYLRITGHVTNFHQEIVTANAAAFSVNADQDDIGLFRPDHTTFTLNQRALFGTTAENWANDIANMVTPAQVAVEDITIPVMLYQNLVARAKDGLPKVRATTVGIGKCRIQVGDFVSLPKDKRLQFTGYNGGDPSLAWEVLRKETYILDGHPRIQWLLGLVANLATAQSANNQSPKDYWFSF